MERVMDRITTTNRIDTAKGPRLEVYLRREARLQELRALLEETGVQGPRTPPRSGKR